MSENKWTLTGLDKPSPAADFSALAADFGRAEPAFAVHKRTLRGGLGDAVDVVEIDNGRFRFTVLPTRGMGIWKGWLGDVEVGWQSPVQGPVHPRFVPLMEPGGLGWLDGFDEWIVRCGLESNGPPDFDDRGALLRPLHGRIANRPAGRLELEIDVEREEIRLSGIVTETRFLFRQLQLKTTITTHFGASGLSIHDEVTNLAATPTDVQLLYHINFGYPWIDPGAKLIAPVDTLVPRDGRAAEGIDGWHTYAGPEAGFAEQVYFLKLRDSHHRTRVLLKNSPGTLGASLIFDCRQLPCFTLWKNTGARADGYVTGLEPATNYPNARSFEARQGRVVRLAAGEHAQFDVAIALHSGTAEVALAESEIAAIQAGQQPNVRRTPQPGWSSAGGA